ncbi:MAG: hypothetical protein ACOYOV_07540 [Bacteroidales bacterium]
MQKSSDEITINGRTVSLTEFNTLTAAWAVKVKRFFAQNIKTEMSKEQSGKLLRSLTYYLKKSDGKINTVAFGFERYGVFQHYGVGRGYIHTPAGVIRGRRPGKKEKLYAKAKNRSMDFVAYGSGSIKRTPIDWFDGTVVNNISELADLVQEFFGDQCLLDQKSVAKMKITKTF